MKKRTVFGNNSSYLHWKLVNHSQIVRDDYIVTFGGGTVLNRSMFRKKDIEDDGYLKVAASADDLWYSKLLSLDGNDVVVVPELQASLHFIQHSDGLTNHNYPRAARFLEKVRMQVSDKLWEPWVFQFAVMIEHIRRLISIFEASSYNALSVSRQRR